MKRFLFIAGEDKSKLRSAAELQFKLPGPPVIYYGTEVGMSSIPPKTPVTGWWAAEPLCCGARRKTRKCWPSTNLSSASAHRKNSGNIDAPVCLFPCRHGPATGIMCSGAAHRAGSRISGSADLFGAHLGTSTNRCTTKIPKPTYISVPGCACTPPRTTWTWPPCWRSYPTIHATFNLTPSLICQLDDYANGR